LILGLCFPYTSPLSFPNKQAMSRQRTFIPLNAGPTYLAEGKREDWLRTPLTGNLSEIHGIKKGGVYETKFHEAGIMNTWQLIGEFLKMRGVDSDGKTIDSVEHCERFFIWLGAIGIGGSSKPSITLALAEKINLMIPGFFIMENYPVDERA